MALTRPWVSPQSVKDYSDFNSVKNRADGKLEKDIRRAENQVINYINRRFTEIDPDTKERYIDPNTGEPYEDIPQDVQDAVIILAEYLAVNAMSSGRVEGKKSETFDDYSYTRFNIDEMIANLGVNANLDPYILEAASGSRVVMKMRKI